MLKNKSNSAKFWLEKINTAEHNYQPYFDLIDETRECYKLQRGGIFRAAKLSSACNIFWSSIETLKPFLYFKQPKPCIALMHQNPTDAEALACKILERALQWNLDHFDFDSVAKYARNDFLISGCGILWEVYKPKFATILDENGQEILLKTDEKVVSEYVDPKCFLADSDHVGIWEDVTWVARKHYLSRQNIFDVFGDKKALALLGPAQEDDAYKQECVYEIWDKNSRKVFWLLKNNADDFLKVIDKPLDLDAFFPCPKPIFATMAANSIIPVPDYTMIKADIEELSGVIDRMSLTMKALKVTGAFDSSFPNLADILNKDVALVAVADFDKLKNAGGLKGIVDFMPIEQYITALQALATRRDDIIQNIYQVTGVSDIMRGSSNPTETATAVKQKTNFGTLRNQDRQNDMQRFICDLYRLKAEIICEQFSFDSLTSFLTLDEKENIKLVEEAVKLLKTDKVRNMVLSVETDMVFDQEAEALKVTSAVQTIAKLIQDAFQLVSLQPKLLKLYQKMVESVVATMPKGRAFSAVIGQCFDDIAKELANEGDKTASSVANTSNSTSSLASPSNQAQISFSDQLKMMQMKNDFEIEKEKNALKARELALKESTENAKLKLSDKELDLEAKKQAAQ